MKLIGHNDVHLWVIPQANHIEQRFVSLLSITEKERLDKFKFRNGKLTYYSSHVAMRLILSQYLMVQPNQINYHYLSKGKPHIDRIQFNLSHANEIAILGITKKHIIGVDVEFERETVEFEQLAQRFFSTNEANKLISLDQKVKAFYKCWTRKEAFIKAIGEGLSFPLQDFEVSFLEDEEAEILYIKNKKDHHKKWSLIHLEYLPDRYTGAIAIKTKQVKLSYFQFDWS